MDIVAEGNKEELSVIQRDKGGRWIKGQSGNPAGKEKFLRHVNLLALGHSERAIQVIIDLMNDESQSGHLRYMCAVHILDRAVGRPTQYIAPADDEKDITPSHMTGEQLKGAILRLEEMRAREMEKRESIEGDGS